MTKQIEKPTPEAKALSLYLMAFKKTSPNHKEKSRRLSKRWNLVLNDEMEMNDYLGEVQNMLNSFGGYAEVVEQTVKHYIEKTGAWKLEGNDKYCIDAQEVADKIMNK